MAKREKPSRLTPAGLAGLGFTIGIAVFALLMYGGFFAAHAMHYIDRKTFVMACALCVAIPSGMALLVGLWVRRFRIKSLDEER